VRDFSGPIGRVGLEGSVKTSRKMRGGTGRFEGEVVVVGLVCPQWLLWMDE
jgi:hypothetical protein